MAALIEIISCDLICEYDTTMGKINTILIDSEKFIYQIIDSISTPPFFVPPTHNSEPMVLAHALSKLSNIRGILGEHEAEIQFFSGLHHYELESYDKHLTAIMKYHDNLLACNIQNIYDEIVQSIKFSNDIDRCLHNFLMELHDRIYRILRLSDEAIIQIHDFRCKMESITNII